MTYHRRSNPYTPLASAIEENGGVPCQEMPFLFFPEDITDREVRRRSIEVARRTCAQCPVRLMCFEYAMNTGQRFGIWGGTLPSER